MDYNVSYRNKDKSVQCIISYKDSDGKWRQKSKQGLARQRDYKDWIRDTVEGLEKTIKVPIEFKKITFKEFRKVFLKDKRNFTENTKESYENSYKWFKALDGKKLINIGYIDIKPCVDKMQDGGLKNSTIRKYLADQVAIFNHAKENYEIIAVNPIRIKSYELLDEEKKDDIKALNKADLNDLLSRLNGKDYIKSLIASKCGLRIGEIIGLQDTAFDFKKAEIKIDKQWKIIDRKTSTYGFGPPKSPNSYRIIPIPTQYVTIMKNYVANCVIGIDRRIFTDSKTNSASTRLSRKYKNLKHDISVHDLRHTYATTLLANGFDYETVARLMGDKVETIIKTYSHFTSDMLDSAKTRIDNIL